MLIPDIHDCHLMYANELIHYTKTTISLKAMIFAMISCFKELANINIILMEIEQDIYSFFVNRYLNSDNI